MAAPFAPILGSGNCVPAQVDARLTSLVRKLSARPAIPYLNIAVARGDGSQHWSAVAGPDPDPGGRQDSYTGPGHDSSSGSGSGSDSELDHDSSPGLDSDRGSDPEPGSDSDLGFGSDLGPRLATGRDRQPGPETPFLVASITKRFIITLLIQAMERGEIDLSTPITTYLPGEVTTGLHVRDGIDRTSAITVRHLASHTSGLPDFFEKRQGGPSLFAQLIAGRDVAWSFEDAIRIARQEQRPHFIPQDLAAPRQRARYSDTGFQLLIRILETVTGQSFADLLSRRIIEPLDLRHTWLPGHRPLDPQTPEPTPLYAQGRAVSIPALIESTNDLFSTTGDLLTFGRALHDGELFAEPGSLGLLTERSNRLRNAPVLKYGLGTMFFTVHRLRRGRLTLVGHSGATGTWLFHCPELDLFLTGTVDRAKGQAIPFRIMARVLSAWEG